MEIRHERMEGMKKIAQKEGRKYGKKGENNERN
jgi:hypothetical protein